MIASKSFIWMVVGLVAKDVRASVGRYAVSVVLVTGKHNDERGLAPRLACPSL